MESLLTSPVGDVDSPDRKLSQRCTGLSAARKRHFCGSVITHYDTFILRLQSIVGSPRGYAASAEASAGFAVCSAYTNRKNRRGQKIIHSVSAHKLLPTSISNSADFSMGTGVAEGRAAGLSPRRSQRLRRLFWWYQIYRRNRRSRRAAYLLSAS